MPRPMKDSGVEWLGEIPADFNICRLKFLLSEPLMYGANKSGIPFEENLPRYIRITDITTDGKLKDCDKLSLDVDSNSEYILLDGDLLFARSGASVGKTFLFKKEYGLSAFAGYLIRARTKQNISSKYLFYYSQSSAYDEWKRQVFIQSTIQNIGADKYNQLPVVIPPLDEQQRIATFLDGECARIDSVIEKTRASIVEYKKLKQAIITRAVTKGIRPARTMKDSGVEWLGYIPTDWKLGRIGQLYTERKEKVSDVDFPPLSVTMKGILPQLSTAAKSDAHDDRKLLRKGDFAINSRSDRRGSCGISSFEGSVSLINIILTPREEMHPAYYDWLFHSTMFSDEFYKWGHGIVDDLWTTNWQDMKKISVPLPLRAEQKEIAQYLDEKTAAIDLLVEKKNQLVTELERLKKSLIFEYVTGKKAVPA